ncbi:MAG TPA: homoserine kinase, partial [Oscillospiraceae bacterium]|nr:homoserine kinase [Oscillospiraceae bacterium]
EGHPDNVTPAILGGLVTTALDNGKVFYVKQEIATDLRFVTFVPDFELQTSVARAALPKEISHKDAVFNLSRAALMSVSLYSGKYENLRIGADDRLQQPYRLSLIPGAERAFSIAYDLGAYASYISGAGSTVMAIIDARDEGFVSRARKALDGLGLKSWGCTDYSIDNTGTQIF